MSKKMISFNAIVHLRRDNDYNFNKIKDTFIPAKGEVCIVDTASQGMKFKIGDGIKTYAQLGYVEAESTGNIIKGYYHEGSFYEDSEHTSEITPSIYCLYVDLGTNSLYIYQNNSYIKVSGSADIPMATPEIAGIMKLYNSLGNNIDGSVDQKTVTEFLNDKAEIGADELHEMLIIN